MSTPEEKPKTRPCQGCGKPIPITPPFNGREAVWACMECYCREHEQKLAAKAAKRGAT
jgi:hypothetical protein